MNNSRRLGSVDFRRLDDLVRRSNAGLHPAIAEFVDGGHRRIGQMLRSGSPPDAAAQRFLDALQSMQDYVGTSYRVSQITLGGLAALRRGRDRQFADSGIQCAFVLPCSAATWAAHAAQAQLHEGVYRLFSIFDESVPQKNLSTARLADHVAVPPGTPLRLKALRIIASQCAAGPGLARVVAHFARANHAGGTPYDLYSGGYATPQPATEVAAG
ncbi:hypothetical protein [Paraburkholderia phytofirmans]|uniref:Uncharacterized protein n=1 Tax=Paraburkholderia phytofirmans OLGA172 TaxID=1417228 RepID=A0A160FJ19_9BURK|nr:hypothetical protein [Paraburkholderia phytofirmans]ANB71898.1 hypothetical protein AYM40_05555 [Paraburkholderia phytofirmans OLGA172]